MVAAPSEHPLDSVSPDVLIDIFQRLSIQDLARFAATARRTQRAVDELGWDAHVRNRFPGARDLPLSPSAHAWSARVLARHLYLYSTLAIDRRQFAARALPLPPISSPHGRKPQRSQSTLRSLMAKSARRIVFPSPTDASSLIVYDFREAAEGHHGEAELDRTWQATLRPEVGVGPASRLPPLEEAPTLRVRAERLAEMGAATTSKGSGGLLSPDLTGLVFVPPSWTSVDDAPMDDDAGRPRDLFLAFANGTLQRVRLPSLPTVPPRFKKSRRGRAQLQAHGGPAEAVLVQTLPHPASSIESLSVSGDHLVATSLSGVVRLYPRSDVSSPSEVQLAPVALGQETQERCRPYAALHSEDRCHTVVGAAGPTVDRSLLIFQSDQTGAVLPNPRSLLSSAAIGGPDKVANPAVYSLSGSRSTPALLLSGWSSPASSLCVHDLRLATRRPVYSFTDKIADQPFYSATSSFLRSDGGYVMGGMGSRGHVGLFDTRAAGKQAGWTAYAPSDASGRQASGSVGSLAAEGGRVWGCTPQAAFCLDFTAGTSAEEGHVVRYYEHHGGRMA